MSLLAPGVAVFFMVDPGDLPPLGAGVAGLPGSLIFGSVGEPEMAHHITHTQRLRRSLRLDVVGFSGVNNIQRAVDSPPTRRYRHASSFRAPSSARSIDRGRGRSRLKALYHTRSRRPRALLAFRVVPFVFKIPTNRQLTPPAGRTRDTAPPPCFPCRTARAGAPPPVECPAPAPARCCPSRQPARR